MSAYHRHAPVLARRSSCRCQWTSASRTAVRVSTARASSCRQPPAARRRRSTWRAAAERRLSDDRVEGSRRRRIGPEWRGHRSRWPCRCSCRMRTSPACTAPRATPCNRTHFYVSYAGQSCAYGLDDGQTDRQTDRRMNLWITFSTIAGIPRDRHRHRHRHGHPRRLPSDARILARKSACRGERGSRAATFSFLADLSADLSETRALSSRGCPLGMHACTRVNKSYRVHVYKITR